MTPTSWKIWIDTGGTFTDCLAEDPRGQQHRLKVLSSSVVRATVTTTSRSAVRLLTELPFSPDLLEGYTIRFLGKQSQQRIIAHVEHDTLILNKPVSRTRGATVEITAHEEVPVLAARLLTGTKLNSPFPAIEMRLGSTRGTNALLERKGARTVFIVTKGFKDLLAIGNQQRPHLFALNIIRPLPLYAAVVEASERLDAAGNVLEALTEEEVTRLVNAVKKQRAEAVAITFLHSYKNPSHERMLKQALHAAGVLYVSVSHELSSLIRIVPRAETTVTNAYLHPVIRQYLSRIREGLGLNTFRVMSSAGGLMPADSFQPKDSLLSGPAGGVIGALRKAKLSGTGSIITFDMGGTSTDVSLCNERPDYRFESVVGDQRIMSPSIAIETIAAGGGSVCAFDGHRFTVGPASAGASPGPACYGAGGPLTITDVNLLLGRLDEQNFSIPVHRAAAERQLKQILQQVSRTTGRTYDQHEILEAFVQIANEKMADAIRKVSVQKGHDPAAYTLVSFGGAGGQHACSLAAMLDINTILVPYEAGLLSAYGIGHAQREKIEEQWVMQSLKEFLPASDTIFQKLETLARKALKADGLERDSQITRERLVFARLKGQETSLEITIEDSSEIEAAFRDRYKKIYGHWIDDRAIEIESVRVRVIAGKQPEKYLNEKLISTSPSPLKKGVVYHQQAWLPCAVFRWESLTSGARITGPALVISANASQFIEPGWQFQLEAVNNAIITRRTKGRVRVSNVRSREAQIELYTNRFTAIAQEMGAMLQRTAFSVNVKERLDFSCALLDATGKLIVNAPHIPVHLGSLGVCVRAVMKKLPMKRGDVVVTNHPAYGGSHLPDITLIMPVYVGDQHVGFVANRAHHAEIGGKQPGSMPADATTLDEEGVTIAPMYLMRSGQAKWKEVERVLTSARYPTRALQENLADLNAAVASLKMGEKALQDLCATQGVKETTHYMRAITSYTASLMKERLQKLSKRTYQATEYLDDGTCMRVSIKKSDSLIIDFTGSSDVHPGNLNATPAIVNSVVLYVLRLLLHKNVPLNEGLLASVKQVLPRGFLNPLFKEGKAPAVVGGNTEISQRLTDTLLKALGLAACSQGTMNNFLFGNERFGYYETICGGVGAGPDFDGASAVHQHMTNTRITDPEILEWRYPVRLVRFEIRKGSGGRGIFTGGDGIVRELLFLDSLMVNVLTQHRRQLPYGMQGGEPGKPGKQWIITANGIKHVLQPVDGREVQPGDRMIMQTPGGGGYGSGKRK